MCDLIWCATLSWSVYIYNLCLCYHCDSFQQKITVILHRLMMSHAMYIEHIPTNIMLKSIREVICEVTGNDLSVEHMHDLWVDKNVSAERLTRDTTAVKPTGKSRKRGELSPLCNDSMHDSHGYCQGRCLFRAFVAKLSDIVGASLWLLSVMRLYGCFAQSRLWIRVRTRLKSQNMLLEQIVWGKTEMSLWSWYLFK